MIKSFKDKETAKIYAAEFSRKLPKQIQQRVREKLVLLAAAEELRDLLMPPGNFLEALKGDRVGQHSIRINQQWRVCFRWEANNAHEVEIVDYH